MVKQAAVTFFYQSGFTVAIEKTLLIFSYWQHESIPESHWLADRDFKGFNNIVVFVPRASAEHHDPVIYTWKQSFPITYVVSSDAAASAPEGANVRAIKQGESMTVANVYVSAHRSTDAGVAFWVRTRGVGIFHAGDLNLWHWREENTLREITRAEDDYYQAVAELPDKPLHLAMFPVDPNLGGFYDAGANHFIMAKKPGVFFPMHWGSREEIAQDYARRMDAPRTTVFALTQARETALVDLTTDPPAVRGVLGDRRGPGRTPPTAEETNIDLSTYASDDPFAATDLPVDLSE